MMDEDYAYGQWRQKLLDDESPELEALKELQRELSAMSLCKEPGYQFGFLCTALSRICNSLTPAQIAFLREKVDDVLQGNAVIQISIGGDFHLNYLGDDVSFAAMAHAYRLGIIDQWITNQKEK